jgi:hypothetical protein
MHILSCFVALPWHYIITTFKQLMHCSCYEDIDGLITVSERTRVIYHVILNIFRTGAFADFIHSLSHLNIYTMVLHKSQYHDECRNIHKYSLKKCDINAVCTKTNFAPNKSIKITVV